MRQSTFGKTGLSVTALGFGAAPIGLLKTDRDRAASILNLLLDAGVNLIDTAAMYQGSEDLIGQAVSHRRAEYTLVSKCGTKVPDVDAPLWSAELVSRTVDRALKNLRTDALDVMLLHSCDMATLKKGDALGALVKARDAGKIKFAGYSGDNDAAAYAASLPDIAVIETSINLTDQANIDRVLPVCRQHNVGVIAKRPIANAAWTGTNRGNFYDDYVKPYVQRLEKMAIRPSDFGMSGDSSDDWTELALRFTLSQPGVNTAIIGTTNPDNARKNIDLAEKGPLPDAAVQKLRQAFKRADVQGKWEGLQ